MRWLTNGNVTNLVRIRRIMNLSHNTTGINGVIKMI